MATPPGGPWGGYPGRGAWRYPTHYSTANAEHKTDPLNVQSGGRISLAVTAIQMAVAGHQFACPINGEYDLATYYAIVAFQQDRGRAQLGPVDGIVGKRTARALLHPYAVWWQDQYHIPSNLAVGQLSWESGGWDPGVEGQLDPRDRGLKQSNSFYQPSVTDAMAYDPFWAISQMCKQMRETKDRLGRWAYAITYNKGPTATETWARTGTVPVDSMGHPYTDYVKAVTDRATYELALP